ncbi:ribonuclease HI [Prolixibacter sp. SD074]|jgi:ribonuclease HI|uniref:ribonuclease HI n=1 Tax=Prolixibacter sp. SD074 TaxID=2652391 RepID=UPI0012724D66|nr:ribonuclease HI [Prolixibacter sp. SD074]GET30267.1 ribonuclease H [Prolixibacter sp. SD074]
MRKDRLYAGLFFMHTFAFMTDVKKPNIIVYTDGASRGNPGPGGYGVILQSGRHQKELSEGFRLTTNNRMELLAVIVALEALKVEGSKVTIYTDSKYVADAVEKGWVFSWAKKRFKGKKNPDLWIRFLNIYPKHQVRFVWVKGHANNPGNERCDELAVEAALQPNLKEDAGYQPET